MDVRKRRRKRILLGLAALVPFAIVPVASAWTAARVARAGARVLGDIGAWIPAGPAIPPGALDTAGPLLDALLASEASAAEATSATWTDAPVDTALRVRGAPHRATVARKNIRKIFVSPEMIRRAVPASGRPAAAWSPRTAEHPAGMMIASPGALGGTILAGDVIYEAEGQALGSPEQLVSIVMQAYRHNARFVSGRLWRHGEPWVVTVEPGWVPPRAP